MRVDLTEASLQSRCWLIYENSILLILPKTYRTTVITFVLDQHGKSPWPTSASWHEETQQLREKLNTQPLAYSIETQSAITNPVPLN